MTWYCTVGNSDPAEQYGGSDLDQLIVYAWVELNVGKLVEFYMIVEE